MPQKNNKQTSERNVKAFSYYEEGEQIMTDQEKTDLFQKVIPVIQELQREPDGWVDLARIGAPLTASGIQYKMLGFPKLRPFLEEFEEMLIFREETMEGKPPVVYVRPRDKACGNVIEKQARKQPSFSATAIKEPDSSVKGERYPTEKSHLFSWSFIPPKKIKALSELALDEKWYYGEQPTTERAQYGILYNYLNYTFRRLAFEKKVLYAKDNKGKEYASFNTGLVDKKYEYIYAFF